MRKSSTPLLSAMLRAHTPLKLQKSSVARRSFVFCMINRYTDLLSHSNVMNHYDLKVLQILQEVNVTISSVMKKLEELDLVTKILQDVSVTIGEGKGIFSSVFVKNSDMKERPTELAKIVKSKKFESVFAKIQNSNVKELKRDEVSAMRSFKLEKSFELSVKVRSTKIALFAQSMLKKGKKTTRKWTQVTLIYDSLC